MATRRPRGSGRVYRPKTKGVEQSIWWIAYSVRGNRIRVSTHTAVKSDAERILRARVIEVDNGQISDPAAARLTLDDLETIVLTDYRNNDLLSSREVVRSYARLREHFGRDILARRFDDGIIETYKTARLNAGAANGTVNRELAALKRGLRLAQRQGRLALERKFSFLREARPRQGFLEPEQFASVAQHLAAHLRSLATFAYWTGWRSGEVKALEWRLVDLRAGIIRIEDSKNREPRTIPYSALEPLREVIEHQRKETDAAEKRLGRIIPWVFHCDGARVVDYRRAWISACAKAGLPGRLVHDMRRSAARNMTRAGIPQSVAMAIGGWKTASVFKRYAIVDERMIAENLSKLAGLR